MTKKILIPLTVVILLSLTLLIFSQSIMDFTTRAVVKNSMSSKHITLEDGLHAFLIGSGGPMPNRQRSGPCIAVAAGQKIYIVDAGDAVIRNIQQAGLEIGKIDSLLLTHFHSDHIASLGEIMMQRWVNGSNSKPLDIIGPEGVEKVVEGFNMAYNLDKDYRVLHHGEKTVPPSGMGGVARPFALSSEDDAYAVIINEDGVKVTAFKVDHRPIEPSVGYKFEYKGRSLVISGDTVYSESLVKQAKGADLLFHNALQANLVNLMNELSKASGNTTLEKITHDIPTYLSTPEDAAKAAKYAGVAQLILYHITPPVPSVPFMKNIFLGEANKYFNGPISMGVDGMYIYMPANSKEMKIKKLFK